MVYKFLNKINSPNDLKNLNCKELKILSNEIRHEIIETVSNNGGHLASNLGVVELTIALHKTFNFLNDKLIWDVGHQTYTHKILTGRRKKFNKLRKFNGISGFTKPSESKYDAFLVGHSSTSISAAVGFAKANEINNSDNYIVVVIGDGALTGGLSFEGLNNIDSSKKLIIILNNNDMSINKNEGGLAKYLNTVRSSYKYIKFKTILTEKAQKIPLIGNTIVKLTRAFKNFVKSLIYKRNLFENLGFKYLGPISGHDIKSLMYMFHKSKECDGPVFIHVKTQKGKGYTLAEANPEIYHSLSNSTDNGSSFSSEFGKTIVNLAKENSKLCAVTAAMKDAVGLSDFSKIFKNRFFDVGIAEQHAVTFCAGLAANGFIPVFAVYSTFLQRSFDQLIHDVSIQNYHIVLAIDRAGLVGEDGETHQGIFDVSFLNLIPNTVIYSPSNFIELNYCLKAAINGFGICAVRYPKGKEISVNCYSEEDKDYILIPSIDKSEDVLIVTYGRIVNNVFGIIDNLRKSGILISILKLIKVYPILEECYDIAKHYKTVIFLEENIKRGGIAEKFGINLFMNNLQIRYYIKAIENGVVKQGTVDEQLKFLNFDSVNLEKFIKQCCLNVLHVDK